MINFIEVIIVIIIGSLIGVLMLFLEDKHLRGKIGNVTFFHLLTFILIICPWLVLSIGILFNLNTMPESFFLAVIAVLIINYTTRLGSSFFKTEVFIGLSQWVIFSIYLTLATLSAFYFTITLSGAVVVVLLNSLIPVVGFYHFNKSTISKSGIIMSCVSGLIISPFLGWTVLGFCYYRNKNAASSI